jgi:hypothetical protein
VLQVSAIMMSPRGLVSSSEALNLPSSSAGEDKIALTKTACEELITLFLALMWLIEVRSCFSCHHII